MNSTDPGHEPGPLDDLPAYCPADFLISHMATERRRGNVPAHDVRPTRGRRRRRQDKPRL